MKMSAMDWIAWILLFVGGLNWGLVGLFKFDLVNAITGGAMDYAITDGVTTFGMIVYLLVGLAALWSLFSMFTKGGDSGGSTPTTPQV